jgi:hypothetical protein
MTTFSSKEENVSDTIFDGHDACRIMSALLYLHKK